MLAWVKFLATCCPLACQQTHLWVLVRLNRGQPLLDLLNLVTCKFGLLLDLRRFLINDILLRGATDPTYHGKLCHINVFATTALLIILLNGLGPWRWQAQQSLHIVALGVRPTGCSWRHPDRVVPSHILCHSTAVLRLWDRWEGRIDSHWRQWLLSFLLWRHVRRIHAADLGCHGTSAPRWFYLRHLALIILCSCPMLHRLSKPTLISCRIC